MSTHKEFQIPFAGFYYTYHSEEIDRGCLDLFYDRETDTECEELPKDFWKYVDYSAMYLKYAQGYATEYLNFLNNNLELSFELHWVYSKMTSPKYYNYSTDKIWVKTTASQILKIWNHTDRDILEEIMEERHKSRSGFGSFYDYKLEDWPENVLDWDEVQLSTLFLAFLTTQNDTWTDDFAEYWVMEDASGCGFVGECVEVGITHEEEINAMIEGTYLTEDEQDKLEAIEEYRQEGGLAVNPPDSPSVPTFSNENELSLFPNDYPNPLL